MKLSTVLILMIKTQKPKLTYLQELDLGPQRLGTFVISPQHPATLMTRPPHQTELPPGVSQVLQGIPSQDNRITKCNMGTSHTVLYSIMSILY